MSLTRDEIFECLIVSYADEKPLEEAFLIVFGREPSEEELLKIHNKIISFRKWFVQTNINCRNLNKSQK